MYNKQRMKKWWMLVPIVFVFGILLTGWVIMRLWNAILVPAAGASTISYWQGIGLLILSRILFGGFKGKPWGSAMHGKDRWRHLSAEEKLQMKAAWKERCAHHRKSEPSSAPQDPEAFTGFTKGPVE